MICPSCGQNIVPIKSGDKSICPNCGHSISQGELSDLGNAMNEMFSRFGVKEERAKEKTKELEQKDKTQAAKDFLDNYATGQRQLGELDSEPKILRGHEREPEPKKTVPVPTQTPPKPKPFTIKKLFGGLAEEAELPEARGLKSEVVEPVAEPKITIPRSASIRAIKAPPPSTQSALPVLKPVKLNFQSAKFTPRQAAVKLATVPSHVTIKTAPKPEQASGDLEKELIKLRKDLGLASDTKPQISVSFGVQQIEHRFFSPKVIGAIAVTLLALLAASYFLRETAAGVAINKLFLYVKTGFAGIIGGLRR